MHYVYILNTYQDDDDAQESFLNFANMADAEANKKKAAELVSE